MKNLFKALSLAPRSIRNKLTVAFALMSIIPMLVCIYLIVYYVFPTIESFWDVLSVLLITVFIVCLGFYLVKKIIYPIIKIAAQAKEIEEGRSSGQLSIEGEDEIGQLSGSLNRLSVKLKENMSELHSFGEKIKQINMEINKKVFALSALLQIGNLITAAANLDEILNLIVEKLSQLGRGGTAFLMFLDEESGELRMCAQANIDTEQIKQVKVKIGQGLLGKVFESARPLIIDRQRKFWVPDKGLETISQTKNLAVLPVTSSGKVIGILGTGNNVEDFIFTDDELELVSVFGKQVAVAVENDILMRKTEELTVKDELTGLYNESYIRNRLDEEIKRAISYQRPCSFVVFEIDNFEQYRQVQGEVITEKTLKKIAQILRQSISDIDKAGRFDEHRFALVLPEKNKRQSMNLAKNISKEIERYALKQTKQNSQICLTLSEGISATPIDGASAVELINKALDSMEKQI